MSMEQMGTPNPEEQALEEIETQEFPPEEEAIIDEIVGEPLPEIEEGLRTDFAREEGNMLQELTEKAGEDPDEPGVLEKIAHNHPGIAKGLRVFMLGTVFAGGMGPLMKPEDAAAQQMRYSRPAATLSVPAAQEAAIRRMNQAGSIQVESAVRSEIIGLEARARGREARVQAWRHNRDVAPIYRTMAQRNRIDAEVARRHANAAYFEANDPKFAALKRGLDWLYGGIDKVLSVPFPLPEDKQK